MSLSKREMRLAMITLGVVLLGLTYLLVEHQQERLREVRREITAAQLESLRNQRELQRRPELLQKLERVRAQLPQHPEGRDVRAELSRQIQSLAAQSGLRLTGLTPEQEERLPEIDLYQLSIRCTWTGTPEALVGFLVRLQALGAVMDVRELRVRASTRPGEPLTGTFTVDCAFSRIPATPVPEPPGPPS
jgi:hypothetical protein